ADGLRVVGARDRDGPDHRDRRDGVRERHERRVEQAGHAADHAQADEGREDEHEQHRPVVDRRRLVGRRRLSQHQGVDHVFRTSPAWVTQVSRMISSSKSTTSVPSRVTCNRKLEMFLAYIWLACSGSVLGRLSGPKTTTPLRRTSFPGCVASQFPPVSAARSTITAPGFIPPTAAAVIRTGARLPGIAAVVITTSASFTCSAMNASSRRWVSSDSCFAYPPDPSACSVISSRKNFAPRLSTCSCTAGRTSNADTTAPSRRAVAIACSPATPAPSTSTRAGVSVPAAVTSIGKNRPAAAAASSTALYPATVACEDSTSMDCARVMRGNSARLNAVTFCAASAATASRAADGWNTATSAVPSRNSRTSAEDGGCTLRTTSLCPNRSAAAGTTVAPAAWYAASPNDAASPAPRSTRTARPDFASLPATSGINATRRSSAAVSFGTPIFILVP